MVIIGSATVPASGVVPVFTLPAGLCNFTLYQIGAVPGPFGGTTVYLGSSTATTTGNGFPVTNTPLNQETFVHSGGQIVYATGGGTAASIQYVIATAGG